MLYPLATARAIAERNNLHAQRNDPRDERWTYTVEPRGTYFAVVVRDETGFELGDL